MTHDDALKLIEAVNGIRSTIAVGAALIMLFLYFINANIRRLK